MSRAAGKPKRERAGRDAVRGQVLATVERLVAEGESYTSLGVGRISEEAGVSRAAFYKNFADKGDLLMQLTAAATEDVYSASAEWIASDPKLGVEGLSRTHLRSIRAFREHAAAMAAYTEVAAYDEEVARVWTSRVDSLVDAMAARIEAGQRAGEINPGLAPRVTAELIVWGAERAMTRHVAVDDGGGDEALARELADAVWTLLYGP